MRLLLTRPEPDAQRTAAALRARGHEVVIAPLIRIETLSDAAIGAGPWAAILVTSANAARAIKAHERLAKLSTVPVFAVGRRSAEEMRAAGFSQVTSADGDVGDLARLVAERIEPAAPLLYLAGEERSGDLAGDLRGRGWAVHTAVVYRAVATASLPNAAAASLAGDIGGVIHFSRRSAEVFVRTARDAGLLASVLRAAHYCLSAQVAQPLEHAGAAIVHIAPQPVEAALIELICSEPA